jgi:hypothetical protein
MVIVGRPADSAARRAGGLGRAAAAALGTATAEGAGLCGSTMAGSCAGSASTQSVGPASGAGHDSLLRQATGHRGSGPGRPRATPRWCVTASRRQAASTATVTIVAPLGGVSGGLFTAAGARRRPAPTTGTVSRTDVHAVHPLDGEDGVEIVEGGRYLHHHDHQGLVGTGRRAVRSTAHRTGRTGWPRRPPGRRQRRARWAR